jgi:hypothetical protein
MTDMFSLMSDSIEEVADKIQGKFYGVVEGTVINVADLAGLGRVQVQLPFIDSVDLSPWARIATPMAGFGHGIYCIPNIGDRVLVAFEHGDIKSPYVIGSLWNALSPPPLPSSIPQIRTIRTLVGNQIVFSEVPPTITLQTAPTPPVTIPLPPSPVGPHQTVIMSPAGVQIVATSVQIVAGNNVINMTPDGITIVSASNLTLAASGAVSITGSAVSITGGAAVNITGALVTIN